MNKKFILLLIAAMFSSLSWAGYGILVNGCDYYQATHTDDFEGFTQYLAHVSVKSGDYCQLYDDESHAAWMCSLNGASVGGFTKDNDKLNCSKDGCYDFYIKLKFGQDELYVGNGSNCSTPQNLCDFTLYIAGNGKEGSEWCCGKDWQPDGCELTDGSKTFALEAGTYEFKITNGTWDINYGGSAVDKSCSTPGYVTTTDGNVCFKLGQSDNVTISFANTKICVKAEKNKFEETYVSSVPSQCSDVLMQGFYWDSYAVSENTPGTNLYGDTRWKTLLAQSGEIGAYFDLIWLPPSAYANGTGYHPKQYSNQSSDWGSRAELQTLIRALHNSGTRVVADVVINHMDAMGAWCDLSTQNFGDYGIFVPDNSWISQDDEMNWPENKADTLAGECWGKATGPHEDAPWYDGKNEGNYTSARDWAHAKPEVQEMCRAYTKWLRNEIGYDGFRYDYCKGLHASHFDDYNKAGEAYISFLELWASNDAMKQAIQDANYNTMVLDFQSKYSWVDELGKWGNYVGRGWGMMADDNWKKYAVTWLDSHDNFLRGNGGEFGGEDGKSMTLAKKDRLLQANAELLSMPGIPCVFYPHWKKYSNEIKDMINARHCAGVHNESEVKDEYWDKEGDFNKGYQATIVGNNGFIVLQLGTKATKTSWDDNLHLMASGNGYSMWVGYNNEVAPRLIVTPDATFEDLDKGIDVTITAAGGTSTNPTIFYTTDGSEPTTKSATIKSGAKLNFKQTTTLKVMAAAGSSLSKVQTYTYTYREPLQRGIVVRFAKPETWDKVYFYSWQIIGTDSLGNPSSINLMGAYPGQRIYQDADGWYSYEFSNDLDSINFCINSGNDCGALNVRSNDLVADYDVCYGWQDATDTLSYYEILLDCETDLHPDFDLVITPESSFFRDKEAGQRISIHTVGAKNAMIFYTTDGSTPTTMSNSAVDSVSFVVNQTTTVKAFAVLEKKETPIYSNTFTYKAPQSGPLEVRFQKPETQIIGKDTIEGWKDLYIYAFTRVKVGTKFKDTPYALDGKNSKWPGIKWTTTVVENGITWHTWTMKPEIKEIYVIFNIGSNKTQTQDIFLDENACYVWNPSCWRAVLSPLCDGQVDDAFENIQDEDNYILNYNDKMYNILGMEVDATYRGIVIQNGHKFLLGY